jgi:uncharacterized protein
MDNSIDTQFIDFIVKSLVSKPENVKIERSIDEKGVLLELTVDPEDLGRVIGKRGATAQSIRTLLRALGTKNEARYNLKIIDNGEPRPERRYEPRDEVRHDENRDNSNHQEYETSLPVEEPAVEAPKVEETPVEEPKVESSDKYSKTRAELEELDDLDL